MYSFRTFLKFIVYASLLISCNQQMPIKQQQTTKADTIHISTTIKHCIYSNDTSEICKCPAEFELKDSLQLVHIKDQFYKSKTGHLYERTISITEVNGHVVDKEYFAGGISQDINPFTFEQLEDGWYAKDNNYVYYYRPTSGGMQISKIDTADVRTFNLLAGHYKYASDKNFFYDEMSVIVGFKPNKTNLRLDNEGRVTEMSCENRNYKFELVD